MQASIRQFRPRRRLRLLQFQEVSVFPSSVRLEYSKRGRAILALTGGEIEQIYSFNNVRIASKIAYLTTVPWHLYANNRIGRISVYAYRCEASW